jgi:pre-mRNA-splicing factor SYF1
MFTIYIAKATANFGLPATRPIYEKAIEGKFQPFHHSVQDLNRTLVLPDKQTAEMCLRFAALERKLGEIDRARAIYAHASQFCDPRVNPRFWSEWNNFEIETGSEDTFREMLRIKRSVQAQFNTEASYLAAQALGITQDSKPSEEGKEPQDAMAAAEKQAYAGANGPAFVAATKTGSVPPQLEESGKPAEAANADEIRISDDEEVM